MHASQPTQKGKKYTYYSTQQIIIDIIIKHEQHRTGLNMSLPFVDSKTDYELHCHFDNRYRTHDFFH